MPIFKLTNEGDNIENAFLMPAAKTNLELEKHLENWLETVVAPFPKTGHTKSPGYLKSLMGIDISSDAFEILNPPKKSQGKD